MARSKVYGRACTFYFCPRCVYYSENKGDVVVYQWIEEVREFLNQKASELHIDSLGTVIVNIQYILFCH